MQLIVISSVEHIAGEAAIVNDLFDTGMSRFHLRKPGNSAHQTRTMLDEINPAFYNRIALHQDHGVAHEYGINRLHYTEQMRIQATADDLEDRRAKGYILSTSAHEPSVLPALSAFDYLFFGPVFHSLSKPGYHGNLPPEFQLNKGDMKPLVIGLGGVEAHHLPAIKAMGFDGAAVLGAIWIKPEKAVRTFENLLNITKTI